MLGPFFSKVSSLCMPTALGQQQNIGAILLRMSSKDLSILCPLAFRKSVQVWLSSNRYLDIGPGTQRLQYLNLLRSLRRYKVEKFHRGRLVFCISSAKYWVLFLIVFENIASSSLWNKRGIEFSQVFHPIVIQKALFWKIHSFKFRPTYCCCLPKLHCQFCPLSLVLYFSNPSTCSTIAKQFRSWEFTTRPLHRDLWEGTLNHFLPCAWMSRVKFQVPVPNAAVAAWINSVFF